MTTDERAASDGFLPPHHERCLGCGPDNLAGFGLRARQVGDRATARRRPLTIEAWDEAPAGSRKRVLRGVLRDPDGRVLAEAKGLFVVVDPSHFHAEAGGMPEHWRRVPW